MDYNKFRIEHGPMATTADDGRNGLFHIMYEEGSKIITVNNKNPIKPKMIKVMAADLGGWVRLHIVHISSLKNQPRTPTKKMVNYIKSLFFLPDDCPIQFTPSEGRFYDNDEVGIWLWLNKHDQVFTPPLAFQGIQEQKPDPTKEVTYTYACKVRLEMKSPAGQRTSVLNAVDTILCSPYDEKGWKDSNGDPTASGNYAMTISYVAALVNCIRYSEEKGFQKPEEYLAFVFNRIKSMYLQQSDLEKGWWQNNVGSKITDNE